MRKTFRAITLALPILAIAACAQEGPAERAGESVDQAGERVRDTIDPPSGPVERAGRAVDRAVD